MNTEIKQTENNTTSEQMQSFEDWLEEDFIPFYAKRYHYFLCNAITSYQIRLGTPENIAYLKFIEDKITKILGASNDTVITPQLIELGFLSDFYIYVIKKQKEARITWLRSLTYTD